MNITSEAILFGSLAAYLLVGISTALPALIHSRSISVFLFLVAFWPMDRCFANPDGGGWIARCRSYFYGLLATALQVGVVCFLILMCHWVSSHFFETPIVVFIVALLLFILSIATVAPFLGIAVTVIAGILFLPFSMAFHLFFKKRKPRSEGL